MKKCVHTFADNNTIFFWQKFKANSKRLYHVKGPEDHNKIHKKTYQENIKLQCKIKTRKSMDSDKIKHYRSREKQLK